MDDPVKDIAGVITTLCTASPSVQRRAVEMYFTPTASFTHPFCRTGSFNGSRWFIAQVYRWYKILSPRIDVKVDSVSYDELNMILYVAIHQTFKIWVVPFYKAQPNLVTVLQLTQDVDPQGQGIKSIEYSHKGKSHGESSRSSNSNEKRRPKSNGEPGKKYYIQSQNDLYQTSEWIKFVIPFGIGVTLTMMWQFFATILCAIGAIAGWPLTWMEENVTGGNRQRLESKEVLGAD